jgi:adenosyl cobinamide kinase/adenosyl cobinamide phosphate guanylyltransferase
VILLLGGARSGKSSTAVRLAAQAGLPVTFVATAEAGDAEMAQRIERHRTARPAGWTTVEAAIDLLAAVDSVPATDFLIVDCLTLWVSNLIGTGRSTEEVLAEADRVATALGRRRCVILSNEVGLGIVPANELARRYRDILGTVNAAFAAAASQTLLMVAGRALPLVSVDHALAAE